MRNRLAVLVLAAIAVAALFILPARAATRNTHGVLRSTVRALHGVSGTAPRQADVNVAWTPAATLPVAVEETGGGAAAGNSFYVPGGYKNFSCGTGTCLNNTVQTYSKTTNTWTNDTADPWPDPGTGTSGWADGAICYDASTATVHIINGVNYDPAGNGFIFAVHWVYTPSAPAGTRWTNLSLPIDASGNIFYSQDSGCSFIGGKMYLYGGYGIVSPSQPTAQIEDITWVYDPATDTWSDTGKLMQDPRLWMGYGSNATTAYAGGGTDNLTTFAPLATTESFTPAGGWVSRPSLPAARLAPGMGVIGKHWMFWGGGDSSFVPSNKTYHCAIMPTICTTWQTTTFNLPSAKWFSAFAGGSAFFNGGGDTGTGVPVNTAEHLP